MRIVLLIAGAALIIVYVIFAMGGFGEKRVDPALRTDQIFEVVDGVQYPTDMLFITREREQYNDKALVLEVPRLKLTTEVRNGVEDAVLKEGVGLYDMSQLPGQANSNVSIAGHRDLYGCEFYDIDKIVSGDMIYLIYEGKRYSYQYMSTEVVEPNDWGPIYSKDFNCVTLTSCDPIGVATKRIVVVGALVDVADVA